MAKRVFKNSIVRWQVVWRKVSVPWEPFEGNNDEKGTKKEGIGKKAWQWPANKTSMYHGDGES